MHVRLPCPSAGVVLGFVALGVALGGTAFAATGQLVNIADPTTPTHVAKVDSSGALSTKTINVVNGQPSPSSPFDTSQPVTNYNSSGTYPTILTTNATLAITNLTFTNSIYNDSPWEAYVYFAPRTGATCGTSPFVSGYRLLTKVNVGAGQTVVTPFPTPIRLKPAATGQSWCLEVGAAPRGGAAGSNSTALQVSVVGFTISGTFTPPPSSTRSQSAGPPASGAPLGAATDR
jgi:hypothetical protein